MTAEQILQAAVADTIAYSLQAELPLQDIVCRAEQDAIRVTFLFRHMESYGIVMQDTAKKDKLIESLIRSLTVKGFDFGEHPRLSFAFSVDI